MSKRKNLLRAAALVAALPLALAGCAANEQATPDTSTEGAESGAVSSAISGIYSGAGASSQEAAQASWVAAFQTANPDVTINYNPVGSGAGRKQFIEGAVAFAGSDSYLSEDELTSTFTPCAADTDVLSLPVYISPIAVAFNLEGVDALNLDAETIAAIFKGSITSWNDAAIVALNPGTELPEQPITVVYRSDDSGTTKNFAAYLSDNADTIWDAEPEDKFPYSFAGAEGAQGTSGVVQAISAGTGTIGYADASKVADLATVALRVGNEFVPYSAAGAAKVVEVSPVVEGRSTHDIAIDLDRTTTESGSYPLVLISYLLVCQQYEDPATAEFIKAYAGYIVSPEGQQAAAAGAGSAPLSEATTTKVVESIDSIG
ncbi:phosphate ABC transporter substrate-binding protein PstS [Actinomyces minihominis]|uniref:phosphate ABC transporter substrate-binding protein PstS n=1 Tax=Actinomyces minihominis TaxID=2002838 RepID=UPI000C089D82|nr:phosphate ABC transporter substrate-binding protein PstS [Actinomyces minihominis]